MATHAIETVELPTGTLEVTAYSPVAGLTVPSFASLKFGSGLAEKVDPVAGVIEVEHWDFQYTEDYSVHANGFWYTLLNGATLDIQVTLAYPTGGDLHFFYGRAEKSAIVLEEKSLISGSVIRTGVIGCNSFLTALKAVTLQQVYDDIETNVRYRVPNTINGSAPGGTGAGYEFVTIPTIINSALALATGQGFSGDTNVLGSDDIEFSVDDATYYGIFDDLYVVRENLGSAVWQTQYGLAWDLVNALCRNVGFIPRLVYDVSAGRFFVRLLTRGRSYAANITLGVPETSIYYADTPALVSFIEADNDLTGKYYYVVDSDSGGVNEPPAWDPDMILKINVGSYQVALPNNNGRSIYHSTGSEAGADLDMSYTLYTRWWNYEAAEWGTSGRTDIALSKYYGHRLGGGKRVYERTYRSIKGNDGSTESFEHVTLCRQTAIDDGVSSRNFYATEVEKNPRDNTLKVRWQEV